MDKKEDIVREDENGAAEASSFGAFLNNNFLGVSILASTLIISATLIVVFGGGGGAASTLPTAPSAGGNPQVAGERASAPEVGDAPMIGNPDAPVTMVEYSDYECPFCGRFFGESLSRLKAEYVDTGKVRFVYKDFPITSIHPEAQKAAEAARCVREQLGDDGYWAMHDTLFENQALLGDAGFKQWARELGADGRSFDTCLDTGRYTAAVQADADQGTALGVGGTPTFFINDVRVVGALPFEQIAAVIDNQLQAAN